MRPYFRIFNPVLQGEKFDPKGDYVRRYVPEIAKLGNDAIQNPFEAGKAALDKAEVRLGFTYPKPMVDHGSRADRALRAMTRSRATREETDPIQGCMS